MIRKAGMALLMALLGAVCPSHGATLDPNFKEALFATAGSQVTGLAWAPDGSNRLFVSRKGGEIRIVKNGVVLGTPFVTVSPVYIGSECGLVGLCFDPNFIENGYVYLFVTVSSSEQQIIRYTAVGDLGTNKTVLIPGLPTVGANHDGGSIAIGPDGKLYWGIGDQGNGTGVDAGLTSLAAKVGRANLDGSVPADNPFADGPGGNNDYIWARGFRNPYTATFQPGTGLLWVNCVGTRYEQIFVVGVGDHAGWNDYENDQPAGYITPRIKYRTNGTDTRPIAAGAGAVRVSNLTTFTTTSAHGFRLGERITISGVDIPSFNGAVFVASTPSATSFRAVQPGPDASGGGGSATTLDQGGAVLGGTFYDSTAVPAAYRGNFFYGDYNSGRIMRATLNEANEVATVDYFGTGIAQYIDAAVGPDGALYYAGFGGSVYRLAYTNYSVPQLVVTPTAVRLVEGGTAALTVRLATAPAGNVTVDVERTSGDSDVLIANGAALTFTPGNWSVPQIVQLRALADANSTNDTAGLTFSASGFTNQAATVHVTDLPLRPFSLRSVNLLPGAGVQPIQVQLNGQPGLTYILDGATNPVGGWLPVGDAVRLTGIATNIPDVDSTNLLRRFYRARVVP